MLSDRIGLREAFESPFNRSDPDKEWHHVKKFGKAKPVILPEAFGPENKDPKETYNLRMQASKPNKVGIPKSKIINSNDSAVTIEKPTKVFPVRKSELNHSDDTLDRDSEAKKEIDRRIEKVRNHMKKLGLTNSHDLET